MSNKSIQKVCYLLFLFAFFSFPFVSAFEFNGIVKDVYGNPLNNSIVNITLRNPNGFSVVGTNTTFTNESGWFALNVTVTGGQGYMYEPSITHFTNGSIDFIGQSLPAFPSFVLQQVSGTTFFLKDGGTLNITAINSTGDRIAFRYQIKDQKLGYPIASNFDSSVSESIVRLARDRNYSVMIFPDRSMPVSFNWNNFLAAQSYNLSNLSRYNFTSKTLHYQFNTTMSMVRVSGFINYSSVSGWDTFTVVPYLFEPGNMVHVTYGPMPYNLSAFMGETDVHNLSTGFYNITLPSVPAETTNLLLFAVARNGSNYYGGFKNLTNLGTSGLNQFNFSYMSGLLGVANNISLEVISNGPSGQINISAAKQTFNIINSTGSLLSSISAHIEATLDYSSKGATEFTWMTEIAQGGVSTFYLPLLNSTGIKELNVFAGGGNYAPKRASMTLADIITNNNITLNSFNPGGINETISQSNIQMHLYLSNSTCDVPNPSSSCIVGGSSETMENFNPFKSIIGGGKLSFRMGIGNISVHYVNVDMLASGPPDALFDSNTTDTASSGTFASALRFGSGGPTIYDYVLVSMPYKEGSSSQSGLNETGDVNISIPLLYDDNWNLIWNASANGTAVGALAGNNSHYSARQGEWANLLTSSTCTKNNITSSNMINSTNPCYIDTVNNRIWIRLPHFSGTGPSITGNSVTATTTTTAPSTSSTTSSSSGTGIVPFWTLTYLYNSKEFSKLESLTKEFLVKERTKLMISGESHYVGVTTLTATTATVNVSSTSQQKTLSIGEQWKVDVNADKIYDLLIKLNSIISNRATLSIQSINEKIPEPVVEKEKTPPSSDIANNGNKSSLVWGVVLILVALVLVLVGIKIKKSRN